MKNYFYSLLLSILFIFSLNEIALSDYGKYEIKTPGNKTNCSDYLKERKKGDKLLPYHLWFFGYIGAFNNLLYAKGILNDNLNTIVPAKGGTYRMIIWVDEYCKSNPDEKFVNIGKKASEFFLNLAIKNKKSESLTLE